MTDTPPPLLVHVVAAAIVNARGEVLIARRPPHVHQGGLWEFPGGKVEAGETAAQALARELHEELGIEVPAARPLIRVRHAYRERDIVLDVWRVDAYTGEPQGYEGQPLAWRTVDSLRTAEFPAANHPILTALRLPACYLITPEPDTGEAALLAGLERALRAGTTLVQLRANTLPATAYRALAMEVLQLCRRQGAKLLLNAAPEVAQTLDADGVHLSATRLMALQARPLSPQHWVAASCHNMAELRQARAIGVDFAVLGPVLPTASHPHATVLGWQNFQTLAQHANLPVYALGGLQRSHLAQAWQHGAQGIAAIRGLWDY